MVDMCATKDTPCLETVIVRPNRQQVQVAVAGVLVHDSLILPCPSTLESLSSIFRSTGSLERQGQGAYLISRPVRLRCGGATKAIKTGAPAYLRTLHEAQKSLREVFLMVSVSMAPHKSCMQSRGRSSQCTVSAGGQISVP